MNSFMSLDFESTSQYVNVARIVEWGLITFKYQQEWKIYARHSQLVDPGVAIPAAATAVHQIDDAVVAGSPPTRQALTKLLPRLRNVVVLGYNLVEYDIPLLLNECRRHGLDDLFLDVFATVGIVDVMPWAVRNVTAPKYRRGARTLGAMAARVGVGLERAHNAADDAEATGRLALALVESGAMPPLGEAVEAARSTWAHLRRR